jgi:hypothetical protein
MSELVVDRGEIEVHLAGKLRLEFLNLKFDDNEAAQPEVVEEQVQIIVLAADLKVILTADEGEALSKFQD